MKDLECKWNTNSEHYRNEADREKSLQEIVQVLKFPEPTSEDAKLEIKAIKPEKVVRAYTTFMC
jgi:hypothetical protein